MLRCCWRPVVQLVRPYTPSRLYSSLPKGQLTPLAALRAFLAPTNLAAPEPVTYTPKELHQLYRAVEALPPRPGGGNPLNVYQLNQLLELFGSLSLPPPRPKCIFLHPFVSRIPAAPFRTYWPLVLDLAEQIRNREKRKFRTGAYHYWVMRAHLARMPSIPNAHDDPADEATARYMRIRGTPDLEVHVSYLRAMLAMRRSTHLPQIVDHLCRVLVRHANPDGRFPDLLWEIILGQPDVLPPEIQSQVLAMLWTRMETHPYLYATRNPKPREYVFDTISGTYIRLGVTVPQLCVALATALFPHFRLYLPPVVWTWAAAEARAVFSPHNPAPARWGSLVFLALYAAPREFSGGGGGAQGGDVSEGSVPVGWRTVFALALLERTVPKDGTSAPARLAVRHLWRMWKNARELTVPPLVRRVVVGAFLRLAARTRDGPLKDGCQRYCITHGLWGTHPDGQSRVDVAQTTELFVNFAYAALHTGTQAWPEIFEALPPGWRARVADALFRAFVSQDVAAAHDLHAFCRHHEIAISVGSSHALALVLAGEYFPEEALRFLADERFSGDQLEELLDQIMRTLRYERHTFRDRPLADAIAPALARLYTGTDRSPRPRAKFSLRYALSVLIASGHVPAALALLRTLHARRPDFFSIHYFLRTMRTLVNVQAPAAAFAVLPLVRSFPPLAVENFRRKLTIRLARKGAHQLAERAYRFGGVRRVRRRTREGLVRAVSFRVREPPRLLALKIEPILARHPAHVPTVRLAVTLLVRARRLAAARRVLTRAHAAGLDPQAVTWLGNIILDGSLWAARYKHARAVRHILILRELLVQRFGFVQDRITLNIMVKALLRWQTFVDSVHIRRLVDYMVRSGYPAAARWRREGGVPFGTSTVESVGPISTAGLPPFISFDRHVRPLYKMFIKALHLRGDLRGARTVIGVLHAAEEEVMVRRQILRRARLAGIVNKVKSRNKLQK
ncbi:hypothetical protein DFH07DRAFT_930877 [Mycena maculata]|uniref:Uncharacterized protein n=1 Tax=Mycena maculata TaxID=230809 RepID=A0AAD7MPS6_9AGAR|nr:hypothetical protein DFH07DRAFT_930877 [Mycena maculata]